MIYTVKLFDINAIDSGRSIVPKEVVQKALNEYIASNNNIHNSIKLLEFWFEKDYIYAKIELTNEEYRKSFSKNNMRPKFSISSLIGKYPDRNELSCLNINSISIEGFEKIY